MNNLTRFKFTNWKINWDSPFYMFIRKHKCPNCSSILKTKKVSKIVNSKSEEAKNFDFSFPCDGYLVGDVKFIWYVFHCDVCNAEISKREMKELESAQ